MVQRCGQDIAVIAAGQIDDQQMAHYSVSDVMVSARRNPIA